MTLNNISLVNLMVKSFFNVLFTHANHASNEKDKNPSRIAGLILYTKVYGYGSFVFLP